MTTSFKQIIWNYIKQLLLNSWQQRRPFWSRQQRDSSSTLPQWCYEEHIVLLYTNTQCTPHCACCQTPFFSNHFVFSQGSGKSKSSQTNAEQLSWTSFNRCHQHRLVEPERQRKQLWSGGQQGVDLPHCTWWHRGLNSFFFATEAG